MSDQTSGMRAIERERDPLYLIVSQDKDGYATFRREHSATNVMFVHSNKYPLSESGMDELLRVLGDQALYFGAYSTLFVYYSGEELGRILQQKTGMLIGDDKKPTEIRPLPRVDFRTVPPLLLSNLDGDIFTGEERLVQQAFYKLKQEHPALLRVLDFGRRDGSPFSRHMDGLLHLFISDGIIGYGSVGKKPFLYIPDERKTWLMERYEQRGLPPSESIEISDLPEASAKLNEMLRFTL